MTTALGSTIDDKYLTVPPLPIERTVTHTSQLDSVRCGNRNFGKQYSGSSVELGAGPNEVLYADTAKTGISEGISANGGDHPDKFPHGAAEDGGSAGFEFTYASPAKMVGHAWCQVAAFENPGDREGFVVIGKTVERPVHSGSPMSMHPVGTKLF